jgi:hypothetical protein
MAEAATVVIAAATGVAEDSVKLVDARMQAVDAGMQAVVAGKPAVGVDRKQVAVGSGRQVNVEPNPVTETAAGGGRWASPSRDRHLRLRSQGSERTGRQQVSGDSLRRVSSPKPVVSQRCVSQIRRPSHRQPSRSAVIQMVAASRAIVGVRPIVPEAEAEHLLALRCRGRDRHGPPTAIATGTAATSAMGTAATSATGIAATTATGIAEGRA